MMAPKGDAAIAASATAASDAAPTKHVADRDMVFVSYAVEDAAFVRWLAAKLAMCGYRVWWDQEQLRGGAAFPSVIDEAIKTRTFRLVAVISHASAHKANPERERQVALAIGRERKEDFLIPINMGLTPTELPFQVANLTFLPFMESWAEGLAALLTTLRAAGTPCFPNEAAAMVEGHLAQPSFVLDEAESVWLNLFPITGVPTGISRYEWDEDVADGAFATWVHHAEDARTSWAFEAPPDLPGTRRPARDQVAISKFARSKGMPLEQIAKLLLRQYVERRCIARGLVPVQERGHFYFPGSHPNASRLPFAHPDGSETWVRTVGTRKVWHAGRPEQVRYHLAIQPSVDLSRFGAPMLRILPTVFFTNEDGALADTSRNVRRAKATRREWFNKQWLARVAALGRFLGEGAESWQLHPSLATTVSSVPLVLSSPARLDEEARALGLRAPAEDTDEPEGADLHVDDEEEEADE